MSFTINMNETINQTVVEATTLFGQSVPFTNSPAIDIFLITVFVALFITIVNKYMTDQVAIKALRKEMKSMQKNMRELMKKDPKQAQALQKKIMKKNFENMKHSMNPKVMFVTMVPIIAIFSLIGKLYGPLGEFFTPFDLVSWGWLGTYIFFSIINSILMKKALNVA